MTIKQDILDEIARLNAQIALLDTVSEDTFPFGTVVVFSKGNAFTDKWHYLKTGEESWKKMSGTNIFEKSLAEWILEAKESNVGYFEVYVLSVSATPFYASA